MRAVLDRDLSLLGVGLGNDVTARDIEAENPLYLPQAKVHDACCSLGPVVLAAGGVGDLRRFRIELRIERDGSVLFAGEVGLDQLRRDPDELVGYLALPLLEQAARGPVEGAVGPRTRCAPSSGCSNGNASTR